NTIATNVAQGGNGGSGGLGGQANGNLGAPALVGNLGIRLGGGGALENFFTTPVNPINNTITLNPALSGTGNQPPLPPPFNVNQSAGGGICSIGPIAPLLVNNILEQNQSVIGPDYRGFVNPLDQNNFVSNASGGFGGPFGFTGWVNNFTGISFNNNVVNNGSP